MWLARIALKDMSYIQVHFPKFNTMRRKWLIGVLEGNLELSVRSYEQRKNPNTLNNNT
jgi:hypothetical protein